MSNLCNQPQKNKQKTNVGLYCLWQSWFTLNTLDFNLSSSQGLLLEGRSHHRLQRTHYCSSCMAHVLTSTTTQDSPKRSLVPCCTHLFFLLRHACFMTQCIARDLKVMLQCNLVLHFVYIFYRSWVLPCCLQWTRFRYLYSH